MLEKLLMWMGFNKPVLQAVTEPKVLNSVTPVLQLPTEEQIPAIDLTPRFGRGHTPAIQHVDVCPYVITTERLAEHNRQRAIRGFTISD